jgi:hypothetical protein
MVRAGRATSALEDNYNLMPERDECQRRTTEDAPSTNKMQLTNTLRKMSPPRHQQSTGGEVEREDYGSNSDQEDRKPPAIDRGNKKGEAVLVHPQDQDAERGSVELLSARSHIIPSSTRTPQDILCGEFRLFVGPLSSCTMAPTYSSFL